MENLSWAEIERRFAAYAARFTGAEVPLGFARLHPFVNDVELYPLGYVVAAVRTVHWLRELEQERGARRWADPEAGGDPRAHPAGGRCPLSGRLARTGGVPRTLGSWIGLWRAWSLP